MIIFSFCLIYIGGDILFYEKGKITLHQLHVSTIGLSFRLPVLLGEKLLSLKVQSLKPYLGLLNIAYSSILMAYFAPIYMKELPIGAGMITLVLNQYSSMFLVKDFFWSVLQLGYPIGLAVLYETEYHG